MDWLDREYIELCEDKQGDKQGERHDAPSTELQGWRRLFLENSTNGVPRDWLREYESSNTSALKPQLAQFEILAPVRLVGAEMFMLCSRIQSQGVAATPNNVDFPRFFNHVSLHRAEFEQLEKAGRTPLDLVGAIEDLGHIESAAKRWADGYISFEKFSQKGWEAYRDLSAKTTLVDVPQSRALSLSLLEFNTEYSGVCWDLVPLLETIDRALLIDPTLNRPQNGLGTVCPPEVTEAVLRSVGCRVFLLQLGSETVGYYIFTPHPPGAVVPTATLFDDLAHQGLVKDATGLRYGFFHGVAITKAARDTLRRAGIQGYRLLDYQMAQTAVYEGCDTLVCTVRSGPNRNTAKESHVKAGWRETGFEVQRAGPSAVPLEVLLRDTAIGIELPEDAIPPPPDTWGLNPHYRTYTSADVRATNFTSAATISDYEAEMQCRRVADNLGGDVSAQAYHGSLGFYISFIRAQGGDLIHLHQQRPGFDLWYCSATESSAALGVHLVAIEEQRKSQNYFRR